MDYICVLLLALVVTAVAELLFVFIENARQGKVGIGSANDLVSRPNADVSLVQCLSLPLRLYGK